MWLFTPDSFVSIVQHRDRPEMLLARGRFPGDLERVFPDRGEEVEETPDGDYRYRLLVGREEVARAVAEAARGIGYTNFKDEAGARPQGTAERLRALHLAWSALLNAQRSAHTKRKNRAEWPSNDS